MLKKIVFSLILAVAMVSPTLAQDFPARPITVIVPFGAGETDIVARLLAENMAKVLGQNVAVQNIVGAAGVTGMSAIATARPDGYTLGFTPSAPLALHPHMREVPYVVDSFEFIGRAVNAPYFLVVQKSSPWNSVADMLTALKAEPDKYFWASAGVGSLPWIALVNVLGKLEVKAAHVSFAGDADAFQAMAGDRVQIYATTSASINNFDIKPLAIMDRQRDPAYPDVPTFEELGYPVFASQWMTLMAPDGTPADVMQVLNEAMGKACASPEFTEQLAKLGMPQGYLNAEGARAFIQEQSTLNAALLKELAGAAN